MSADTVDTNSAMARSGRRLAAAGLRRKAAARFVGVSVATWDRLHAAGKLPAPVRLGAVLLWNRRELQAFLDHGAPTRAVWQPIWAAIVRAGRSR